jgi:3-polyprenyl-4-hydroxybenzoate decarboxylase
MPNKIVIAITGASGALYAKALLDSLKQIPAQYEAVGVIMSDNAKTVWETELGNQDRPASSTCRPTRAPAAPSGTASQIRLGTTAGSSRA